MPFVLMTINDPKLIIDSIGLKLGMGIYHSLAMISSWKFKKGLVFIEFRRLFFDLFLKDWLHVLLDTCFAFSCLVFLKSVSFLSMAVCHFCLFVTLGIGFHWSRVGVHASRVTQSISVNLAQKLKARADYSSVKQRKKMWIKWYNFYVNDNEM